jgi:hypothetical protein
LESEKKIISKNLKKKEKSQRKQKKLMKTMEPSSFLKMKIFETFLLHETASGHDLSNLLKLECENGD